MPFFDEIKMSFADVPVDAANNNAIDTIAFLKASDEVVKLLDGLKSNFLAPVRKDINGNIEYVRESCQKHPLNAATLQELYPVNAEIEEKLMWLTRGLRFIYYAITWHLDGKDDKGNALPTLGDAFKAAYQATLAKVHSWASSVAVSTALKYGVPTSEDFYASLSAEPVDQIREKLRVWLAGLERIVGILYPLIDTTSPEFKARAKAKK